MYGYEVLKELRERFEGVWTPKTGSIYPSIKRLEEHGLIWSEKKEGTDYYSLTKEGEYWVLEKLRRSPRDIRILTRYLGLIGDAAAETNLNGEDAEEDSQGSSFAEVFEGEENDKSRRAKRLRKARERIAEHLALIDKELKELEMESNGNDQNGGKKE